VIFGAHLEAVMPWFPTRSKLHAFVTRARAERRAHQALVQELASYASPIDRDELTALIEGRGYPDCEEAEILARAAYAGILRDSNPPLWPIMGLASATNSRAGFRH
jgi:hypothetical protein